MSVKGDRVAFHALGAEHHPQGQPSVLEHRPLLDVELKIGSDVRAPGGGVADAVDVHAACLESSFERQTFAVCAGAIRVNRVSSGKGRRAEERAPEPRAFFIGPVDHANGQRRSYILFSERA